MKICIKCNKQKTSDQFNARKDGRNGKSGRCKKCARMYAREWRIKNVKKARSYCLNWQKENPEKSRAKGARWRKAHPIKIKRMWKKQNIKRRHYRRAWYLANRRRLYEMRKRDHILNPLKRKLSAKRYRKLNKDKIIEMGRKLRYGITNSEVDLMLQMQGHRCAICNSAFEKEIFSKRRCIDHDHETKKVRGILCHRCNLGLGHFRDNLSLLLSAAKYLRKKS